MSAVTDCPLCGGDADDRSDLRVHLMVEHRKSDLAALVVDSEREPVTA